MPRSDIFGVGEEPRLPSLLVDDAVRTSSSFFFYVSRVTDALVYFKHKQKRKRERERKLCVSFDDDLLIYVVLH